MSTMLLKDQVLADIVQHGGNVAQFVSFGPEGEQRFCCIRGLSPQQRFASVRDAAQAILDAGAPYVNIRSFLSDKPDGNPFFMGRRGYETAEKVAAKVAQLWAEKPYYIILNEEVDVMDGGFSGVLFGGIAEFAAGHTPRCVDDEKVVCATVPRWMLPGFVNAVYGTPFSIPFPQNVRVEFSVHPGPVGYLRQTQIIWQAEAMDAALAPAEEMPSWPNDFSRDFGDKGFGLFMAHLLGQNVPRTRVESRILPRFSFGHWTGSKDVKWIRTCPRVQEPGRFTTHQGWMDTFQLVQREDPVCVADSCVQREKGLCSNPRHRRLAGIIIQDAVDPLYSGACITDASGEPVIEGIPGKGDAFMIGERAGEEMPGHIRAKVRGVWEALSAQLGPVRFEWVCDRDEAIVVVQMHRGATSTFGDVLVAWEQEPIRWEYYRTEWGLEKFRLLCERASAEGFGIVLQTNLGVTNHFVDNLRRFRIPSRREAA